MVKLTIPRGKTTSKRFEGLLFDLLCCLLVSVGVLLALRQLFRFENPFNLICCAQSWCRTTVSNPPRWYAAVFSVRSARRPFTRYGRRICGVLDCVRGFIVWW